MLNLVIGPTLHYGAPQIENEATVFPQNGAHLPVILLCGIQIANIVQALRLNAAACVFFHPENSRREVQRSVTHRE